jgi:hypothetical protein
MSITRKIAVFGLCGVGLLVLVYLGTLSHVDTELRDRSLEGIYQNSKKIWATRGLVSEGIERNSIASVKNAFDRGAPGTEVDVFYDTELRQFVVTHSRHYRVTQTEFLTLERLFTETGQGSQYFWLDLKKLRHLSSTELDEAIARLNAITSDKGLKDRVYIEGGDPINLSALQRAGFHTIFDTYPLKERFPFSSLVINAYKMAYYFGGFSVMAMDYGEDGDPIYAGDIAAALADVPVFLYHVPDDTDVLNGLYASPSVRVILIHQESARFETM